MAHSIADVAKMSGISSRTLRHYDEIGLLVATRNESNGYRCYEEQSLQRLQRILMLRELGMGLSEISEVLSQQTDEIEALKAHRERLLAEYDQLRVLVNTVTRTIVMLQQRKDGTTMSKINRPENLFREFDAARHDAYTRTRWPREWDESRKALESLTPADYERLQRERTAEMVRVAEFMEAGRPANDPEVLEEIAVHYRGVSEFWTPDAAAFKRLAQTYVDESEWKSVFEAIAPGLAEYHRDAMIAFAEQRLS
ncbi:MerR family transcriptional regulator [Kitasatospora sp. NPDC052896]|uniref:MerR family transcriptional regulator n=1 Tax=Kitasatospora sp. NPDC052896 TaxID=3364061 RepID=UPI0037C7E2C1